jgi:Zn-dependent metalloprotease
MKFRLLGFILLITIVKTHAQREIYKQLGSKNGISNFHTVFQGQPTLSSKFFSSGGVLEFPAGVGFVLKELVSEHSSQTHYRLQQTFDGIPVEHTMLILHTKQDKLTAATGFVVTFFAQDMQKRNGAVLSASDAISTAIRSANSEQYMWEISETGSSNRSKDIEAPSFYPTSTLTWYAAGNQIEPQNLHLAYKVDIYSAKPLARSYYFIDAKNGQLLGREEILNTSDAVGTATTVYVGNRTIHSDRMSNGKYRLHDYTRGKGVITVNGGLFSSGNNYISNSPNWNLGMPARNALDVHWGVEMTYDYYKQKFNRNSYDNKGSQLKSYVNYFLWTLIPNASWDGNSMQYGTKLGSNQGVTAIDVTGHELTHGVTQNTSNLRYSGETGGMNEAMSDIFGKCVQFFARPDDINWAVGNEMNWVIRDMANPNAFQQPDTYGGTYWRSNADVHVLSGVGNYFFYLLVNGGTGRNDLNNNYSVTGIGTDKAAAIVYRTNTLYLTPTSNYDNWRTACINAASDLYGATSNEVSQVKNAWYAVGVGNPAGIAEYVSINMNQFFVQPNPVSGSIATAKCQLLTAGTVTVKIIDRSGQLKLQYNMGRLEAGIQQIRLERLDMLQTGNYFLVLEQGGIVQQQTDLIIIK